MNRTKVFTLSQEGFASGDYPQLDAFGEALVNMLMHSDYFSPACPRVLVFDDRIEFFNPGALPKPLEIIIEEDISMPRNPVLAKFFRVVQLAENAGYGFDKMISGWTAYTGKPPEFDQGRDYTKATFFLKSATQKTTHPPHGLHLSSPRKGREQSRLRIELNQGIFLEKFL